MHLYFSGIFPKMFYCSSYLYPYECYKIMSEYFPGKILISEILNNINPFMNYLNHINGMLLYIGCVHEFFVSSFCQTCSNATNCWRHWREVLGTPYHHTKKKSIPTFVMPAACGMHSISFAFSGDELQYLISSSRCSIL